MNLSFEPTHHRKVRSHTGYIWEPVGTASSEAARAECTRIVREGGVVVTPAETPLGVGRWPWEDRTKPRAGPTAAGLTSVAALFAIPLGLALSAVLVIPALAAAAMPKLRSAKSI